MFYDLSKYTDIYSIWNNRYTGFIMTGYKNSKGKLFVVDKTALNKKIDSISAETTFSDEEILYVHTECTTPRAQIRNNYKCTSKPSKATLFVYPSFQNVKYPSYHGDTKAIYEYEGNAYLIEDLSIADVLVYTDATRRNTKRVPLSDFTLIAKGSNYSILRSEHNYIMDLIASIGNIRWTYEDILLKTFKVDAIDKDSLATILDMLNNKETILMGYRILSEMDYVNNLKLVKALLGDFPINKYDGTVSVKKMLEVVYRTDFNTYTTSSSENTLLLQFNYNKMQNIVMSSLNAAKNSCYLDFKADIDLTFNSSDNTKTINITDASTGERF